MYLIVQNFLDNLSSEEKKKNYINIVENVYLEEIEDMKKNIRYYMNKYNNNPPTINFDKLCR
jgi:hypothetical protein